jgi:hypothetical protein
MSGRATVVALPKDMLFMEALLEFVKGGADENA